METGIYAEKKERKTYLDILRILAIILVLFNHLPVASLEPYNPETLSYGRIFFILFMRINVPLFFMISGTLLLSVEESMKILFTKRIIRFSILLLLADFGMYIRRLILLSREGQAASFSLYDFIRGFLANGIENADSYWFLYAYISLLLMLPFLRPAAPKIKKAEFILLFSIHFIIYSALPLINLLADSAGLDRVGLTSDLSFPLATIKPFFYALCGYYLDRVDIRRLSPGKLLLAGIVSLAGIFTSASCGFLDGTMHAAFRDRFLTLFDYISAFFVFLLIKYLWTVRLPRLSSGRPAHLACTIASLSFGIYLMDPYLKSVLFSKYTLLFGSYASSFIFSLGWVITSFCICGLICYILKKIPLIKKLL